MGALALLLPLAGCMGEGTGEQGMGFLSASEPREPLGKALPQISLYNGSVVVAGPGGYCVDGDSYRRGAGGSFVLLASCDALSGGSGVPTDPAVMTVSVLPYSRSAAQPEASDIAASMAPARVLEMEDGDGISLVHMATGGDALLPGGNPGYWRAGMLINGHVVGLAAYTPRGEDRNSARSRALLLDLAETLREQSPVQEFTMAAPDATGEVAPPPPSLAALLGGLFPNPG